MANRRMPLSQPESFANENCISYISMKLAKIAVRKLGSFRFVVANVLSTLEVRGLKVSVSSFSVPYVNFTPRNLQFLKLSDRSSYCIWISPHIYHSKPVLNFFLHIHHEAITKPAHHPGTLLHTGRHRGSYSF